MKQSDKKIIDDCIERISKGYVWCFTSDSSDNYLIHKTEMIWDSLIFNNDIGKLHLECLMSKGIDNTSDGIEDIKLANEIRSYFCATFKNKMRNEYLPKHFKFLSDKKKAEKQAEDEAKGKSKGNKKTETNDIEIEE